MSYNQLVEDCFFYPKHVGIPDSNPLWFRVFSDINDKSGKGRFCLYMSMDNAGNIVQARFKAQGNPYLIAGLEWLCRQSEGVCLKEQKSPDYRALVNALEIPVTYYAEALLIEKAWRQLMLALTSQYEEK